MLKLKTPILWPPDEKSWLIWKDPDARKEWGQKEKGTTEDETVGWHHRLNGHEFGWTPGVGDGQGGLACCGSWGHKDSDTTERLNWTELCLLAKLLQSCPTLCNPMDYSPPGFSVHGILQTRILEWVAILSSRESSQPRDWTYVSCIAGRSFTTEPPGESQGNNSSYIKCGNPLYKFEINTMLFIYSKHKEITEDVSVLVSLYLQIGYDFFED